MFNLILVCGGPSLERGISLNSVRSFYDNIGKSKDISIKVIFIDLYLNKYFVDETFLYSNTPSDFDFKLANECEKLSEKEFIDSLKKADMVMPVIHGAYGEDGEFQKILEENNIPFVASGSKACDMMYNKANAETQILRKNNLKTIPKLILNRQDENINEKIKLFYGKYQIKNVVIKPVKGGSSFGVLPAGGYADCIEKVEEEFKNYDEILIEEFCKGREFTVVILQNFEGKPVALIPTEIEVKGNASLLSRDSIQENEKENLNSSFFTTRRKYLPTNETHYYNPPRFTNEVIQKIRKEAENLFEISGAKDFLRIDGWLLDSGEIYFSDFNPISGMEQNSFLFQQGAKIGFTHKDILEYILKSSAKRQNISFPESNSKKRVNVLMGGITSERQVSLMSGSNVWLKLLNSEYYEPYPYLMTMINNEYKVMPLSYDIILNHTVEEVIYQHNSRKNGNVSLKQEIRQNLGLEEKEEFVSLTDFIKSSKSQNAYVFLGLHGGFGEGGGIQNLLENEGVCFNGSGFEAASLCMDKYKTGEIVDSLNLPGLRTAKKISVSAEFLKEIIRSNEYKNYWENLTSKFEADKVIIKPRKDGCSTGVVILTDCEEFKKYIEFFTLGINEAPEGTFKMHSGQITLGIHNEELLIEEYIDVDKISIVDNKIIYESPVKWTELTIGVVENKGKYHAFNPSITIANSGVLSLEEKFQGGTGVNITPPPSYIINEELVKKLKLYMKKLCEKINVKDYCRIDVFVNNLKNEIIVIEVNTLPAMTSSTVIFQQAGKENPPISPLKLIENIISNSEE